VSGEQLLVVAAICASLMISSVAGYGGSLILVPTLGALIGPKEGIAFAALILAWNNVFKVIAYRRTLAIRAGWPLILASTLGVWVGAQLLLAVDETVVVVTVLVVTAATLGVELFGGAALRIRRRFALPMMTASGVFSGISGSSGPLKGSSIRCLGLPRAEHVGLASCVSLVGDALKVEIFAEAGLLADIDLATVALTLPLMPLGAFAGRRINRRIGEGGFRFVFWGVVGAYTLRMLGALP
jgi:uncharacterized protein